MYNIRDFATMLQDRPRVDAYAESLRRSIRPGDVVADIGCGTGYFSLLACQLGASMVYAIEPLEAAELARECARASGIADRIEVIRDLSTNVTLLQKADVIISDLRGTLPLHARHIPTIIDARSRLLAPGGVLICERDVVWAALMEYPRGHDRCFSVWETLPGIDQSACRSATVNAPGPAAFDEGTRLSEPRAWYTVDYRTVTSHDAAGSVEWRLDQPLRAHGFCIWFEAELAGGLSYTSGPLHPDTPVYGRIFFPWPREVDLGAGDQVVLGLEARLSDQVYVWTWETQIKDGAGREKATFLQNSLLGKPLSSSRLLGRVDQSKPQVDEEIAATAQALVLMNGDHTQEDVAERLLQEFPRRFPASRNARDFVRLLSMTYAK